MFTTEVIRPSRDVLDETKRLARNLPRVFPAALEGEMRPLERDLLADLQEMPGPIKPGVFRRLATRKQLIAVMIKLRKRADWNPNGGHYRRSGRFVRAWKIELIKGLNGGLQVTNDSGIEPFVTGVRQQPFHKDTGWYESQNIFDRYRKRADDVLIDVWFAVTEFQIGQ